MARLFWPAGGSVRDGEMINAADEDGLAMVPASDVSSSDHMPGNAGRAPKGMPGSRRPSCRFLATSGSNFPTDAIAS